MGVRRQDLDLPTALSPRLLSSVKHPQLLLAVLWLHPLIARHQGPTSIGTLLRALFPPRSSTPCQNARISLRPCHGSRIDEHQRGPLLQIVQDPRITEADNPTGLQQSTVDSNVRWNPPARHLTVARTQEDLRVEAASGLRSEHRPWNVAVEMVEGIRIEPIS